MDRPLLPKDDEQTKMLGGKVPIDIYWKFKEVASKRKEKMEDAIFNAAMLYIELEEAK